jgi:serine beta-lactamase-like protein LACTB, mitochondrial
MAKFEDARLNNRLLKRTTRNLMWTAQKTSDGEGTTYGLGWQIGSGVAPTLNHGGGDWGTSTFIMIASEQRAAIVVLINLNGGNASDLAFELLKIAIGVTPSSTK